MCKQVPPECLPRFQETEVQRLTKLLNKAIDAENAKQQLYRQHLPPGRRYFLDREGDAE